MTEQQKQEITRISKKFAEGFSPNLEINGSGWIVTDPLSVYLNGCGYINRLLEVPATDKHHQVLIMVFSDGSQFIPAASDLKGRGLGEKYELDYNWAWINP